MRRIVAGSCAAAAKVVAKATRGMVAAVCAVTVRRRRVWSVDMSMHDT